MTMIAGFRKRTPLARLALGTAAPDTNGCMMWRRACNPHGYGIVIAEGRPHYAHRLAYSIAVGPIPDGMHLHHTCEKPACVNSKHLELLTPSEHGLRHRWTHCGRGHELTAENLYIRPDTGKRRCLTCDRIRAANRPYRKNHAKKVS